MTTKEILAVIEYVDAKFAELKARDSSDGGLLESIDVIDTKNALLALAEDHK
jgi:hypothetical protein